MEQLCDIRVEIHGTTTGGYAVEVKRWQSIAGEEATWIEKSAIAEDTRSALDQVRALTCQHLDDIARETLAAGEVTPNASSD